MYTYFIAIIFLAIFFSIRDSKIELILLIQFEFCLKLNMSWVSKILKFWASVWISISDIENSKLQTPNSELLIYT